MRGRRRGAKLKKRDVLLAATAFTAGILITLGAHAVMDQMSGRVSSPLAPGSGQARGALRTGWLPESVLRWRLQIEKYGNEYGVDPNLIAIIMTIESNGNPAADSGLARGLMQITDPRGGDIAKKFVKVPRQTYDLTDPETSIEFGAANIRHLIDQFGETNQGPSWDRTVSLVAAGYYGGEGAAMTYRDKGLEGLEDQGTYNYVRYVTTMWRERNDDRSFAYQSWVRGGE